MKILLATYWFLPHVGGVSTHVYGLKRELEHLGHEVDILAHHPDMKKYYMTNNAQILEKKRVKNLVYEKVLAYYKENNAQLDPWIIWREVERYCFEVAASVFNLSNYDLIHTHDIVSTRALWRVKPEHVPLIATIHGCLATEHLISKEIKSKEGPRWKYVAAEELYGALSSNVTIVPTQWLKNLMVQDFKVPSDHITVIPYGMDIDVFLNKAEETTQLDIPTDKKVIACPARLVPVKGHQHLLGALSLLKQTRNDWICWLVGDGELRKSLEKQVKKLGLENEVSFLGSRKDVPSLLNQADIFVLPSLQDNQPFSIMESQVVGTPIVVSNAGGIPEMLEHGKTGLIVPLGESEPLFKSLERLLDNDEFRKELAQNARKFALEKWSLQTMMNGIDDVYKSVLGRKVQ